MHERLKLGDSYEILLFYVKGLGVCGTYPLLDVCMTTVGRSRHEYLHRNLRNVLWQWVSSKTYVIHHKEAHLKKSMTVNVYTIFFEYFHHVNLPSDQPSLIPRTANIAVLSRRRYPTVSV